MVVDYWLSCKELTALQSCRKKSLQNPDKTPGGVHLESIRSLSGVHQESIRKRGGVSVTGRVYELWQHFPQLTSIDIHVSGGVVLHFVFPSNLCMTKNVLQVIEEATELSRLGGVELWCCSVATCRHRDWCGGRCYGRCWCWGHVYLVYWGQFGGFCERRIGRRILWWIWWLIGYWVAW